MPKHAGGRPSQYSSKYIDKINQYLLTVGREATKLPKRVDIALLLDVDEDTLNNWAKKHSEFLGTLTRVDMMQKSQLMDDGLYGGKEVNPNIAKFLLEANHGLKSESKLDVTSQGEKIEPTTIVIVEDKQHE